MNIIERLGKVDSRIIYTLLIIALVWPLARPMGLPLSIGAQTRNTFSWIDALQPGDTVLFCAGYSVAGAGDIEPQAVAIARHLFQKGVRIVFFADVVDGPMVIENILTTVPEARGKQYGVDWVNLGFLAGGENAIAAVARGIREAYPTDFRHNVTANLPILEGKNTAADFDMFIFFTTGNADMFVRQIYGYGVPIIGGLVSTIVPQAEPYVHSGQIKGILAGLRGGAEYEKLLGLPGVGLASMDAQSMGHMLFIVFIAFANLAYFTSRGKAGRRAAR